MARDGKDKLKYLQSLSDILPKQLTTDNEQILQLTKDKKNESSRIDTDYGTGLDGQT